MQIKKRKNNLVILALVVFISLLSQKTWACDCVTSPVTTYIPTSDLILTVKVKSVHAEKVSAYKGYRATVKAVESLKGKIPAGQELEFDSADNSDCSFVFSPNETYLLFAYKKGDKYYVYACSPSRKAKESAKNIRTIKKVLQTKKSGKA